jgi:hypothetical protein
VLKQSFLCGGFDVRRFVGKFGIIGPRSLWLIWELYPLKISSTTPPCGNQPKTLNEFMASYQIMSLGYETFWWWHILTRLHHRCKLENYGTTWWNSSINTTQWVHYKENITYSLNSWWDWEFVMYEDCMHKLSQGHFVSWSKLSIDVSLWWKFTMVFFGLFMGFF